MRRHYVYLSLILLLALAARMIGLDREPLDNDEFYTLRDSSFLHFRSSRPVFFLLLYFWRTLSDSDSVIFLRLPAVLFGVLSVFALHLAGRKLFGSRAALLACLFLALSPFHILHSQFIRMYSAFTFFSLLSLHAFLLLLERERVRTWGYFLLSTVLAVLCHPFAIFLPLCEVVYLAVFRKNDVLLKKFFLLAAAGGIVILVSPLRTLACEVLTRFEDGARRYLEEGPIPVTFDMPVPTPMTVARTLLQFCGMPRDLLSILAIALFFGAPFVLGYFHFREGNNIVFTKRPEHYLCLVIILFPILSVFLVSQFLIIYVHRYFIFAIPVVLLVIAQSILGFRNRRLAGICTAGILAFSLYSAGTYYAEINNPDAGEAAGVIAADYREGDAVLTTIYQGDSILNHYAPRRLPVRDLSRPGEDAFAASVGTSTRVWLFRYYGDTDAGLSKYLDGRFASRESRAIEAVNLNSGEKTPRYEVLLYIK